VDFRVNGSNVKVRKYKNSTGVDLCTPAVSFILVISFIHRELKGDIGLYSKMMQSKLKMRQQ